MSRENTLCAVKRLSTRFPFCFNFSQLQRSMTAHNQTNKVLSANKKKKKSKTKNQTMKQTVRIYQSTTKAQKMQISTIINSKYFKSVIIISLKWFDSPFLCCCHRCHWCSESRFQGVHCSFRPINVDTLMDTRNWSWNHFSHLKWIKRQSMSNT